MKSNGKQHTLAVKMLSHTNGTVHNAGLPTVRLHRIRFLSNPSVKLTTKNSAHTTLLLS